MRKEDLLSRAVEAKINTETDEQRRKLGLLMRKRIIALIDMPREEDEYAHLAVTRGKKFEDEVALGNVAIKFELEADDENASLASGISLSIPILGETILILDDGETEMKRDTIHPTSQRIPAEMSEMLQFFGFLGLIESQFPHPEEYPPGVIPFPKK